jgi:hypothetical protein
MDQKGINFDALMSDMQSMFEHQLEAFEDCEENQMCEYSMKFTSVDRQFVYLFTFDQRAGCPLDVLEMDGYEEVISDLTIADIEMDDSDTKDAHGNPQHPGCLKIKFTFEDENVLIVDGIAYEQREDHSEIFTEFVMPTVIEYIKMGTLELLTVAEYEE